MNGFVYVLSNPSLPDLVKVGRSTEHPTKQRIKQLSSTGVPTPFELEYCCRVDNCVVAEREAHVRLRNKHWKKEFFRCSPAEAIAVIETMGVAILEREIRAEIEAAARAKILEERKLKERYAKQATDAAHRLDVESKKRQRELSTASKVAACVGWPIGALAAFTVAKVIPWNTDGVLKLVVGVIAGAIVGVNIGGIASRRITPALLDRSGVFSLWLDRQKSASAPAAAKNNNFDRSWFRWWHLLIAVSLVKVIVALANKH